MKPIARIIKALRTQNKTMLGDFERKYTPFQILVATVMSARTKDSTTIPLAEKMFAKYKTPEDFVRLSARDIEKLIFPVGFYRVKARNIKKLAQQLIENYDGKVPDEIDKLLALPGVGRKTANCVLAYAFHTPCIPVDIHVHRISNRIGLVKSMTPEETEQQLMKVIPRNYWLDINELFVVHGQTICLPRRPKCGQCPLLVWCDYGQSKA